MLGHGRGRGRLLILPEGKLEESAPAKAITTTTATTTITQSVVKRQSQLLQAFDDRLTQLAEKEPLLPVMMDLLGSPTCNCTAEMVQKMMSIVMDRCMWSSNITNKFGVIMMFLTKHKLFGQKIKHEVFNFMEELYLSHDLLWTSTKYGPGTFRKVVDLTGTIFFYYRVGGERMRVLAEPMIQYLLMLQSSSDPEDLAILCKHMSWSGEVLAKLKPTTTSELLVAVRQSLIRPAGLTTAARHWLLMTIDLGLCRSDDDRRTLPDALSQLYTDAVGCRQLAVAVSAPPAPFDEYRGTVSPDYLTEISCYFEQPPTVDII